MLGFGFAAARTLAMIEIQTQLKRAFAGETEVLHVPILLGPVGLGKTAIASSIALELGYPLVRINSGECGDPTDIVGLPLPGSERYMKWMLNKIMYRATVQPVVLFFDDIDKAPALVEGALLSVFGERTVRDRKLHSETVLLAAGNREGDDSLARRLSESLRTRGTIINLEPNYDDFASYALANPGKVHPTILGFLAFRPALLHKHDPDVDRFPTPRGWVEASPYLFQYSDEDMIGEGHKHEAWHTFLALKVGEAAANDFRGWYSILRKIDLEKLFLTGEIDHSLGDKHAGTIQYAALFAVAQALNHRGAKKGDKGLVKYLKELHPELRIALLTQLSAEARNKLRKALPEVSQIFYGDEEIMGDGALDAG